MSKLTESVLDKIKQDEIKPTSKWYFSLQNSVFWALFYLSVLLGAISISILIYALTHSDIDVLAETSAEGAELILSWIPLIWLSGVSFFTALAVFGMRHTKHGYKQNALLIVGANLLLSMVIGTGMAAIGQGKFLDQVFSDHVPFYDGAELAHAQRWNNPENGRLAGTIKEKDTEYLELEDLMGQNWQVYYNDLPKNAKIPMNKMVRIIGYSTAENEFHADHIMPWRGHLNPERIRQRIPEKIRQHPDFPKFRQEMRGKMKERMKNLPPEERRRIHKELLNQALNMDPETDFESFVQSIENFATQKSDENLNSNVLKSE